jgi:hypothetical protein
MPGPITTFVPWTTAWVAARGFWWPERRFPIAGDAVATWPELCAGWTAFNLNLEQHHVSVRRLAGSSRRSSASGTEIRSRGTRPSACTGSSPRTVARGEGDGCGGERHDQEAG